MLWACILLPQLALDGVRRGMGQPEARSTRTDALGLLAAWAYRYSSMVSLEGDDALVLEVQGSLGLFGPWPRLERMLRDDLHALGFQHRIALAPTPLGACVLAAANDGLALTDFDHLRNALARVPIAQSRISPEHTTALAAMGLRQLRQLFALPRAGLARRFGPGLLDHLDRMTGALADPRQLYRPPDVFEERIELNYEVSHHPALLFPIRRLVNDLAAYLASRDGGVQRFVIALEHEQHSLLPDEQLVRDPALGKPGDTQVVIGMLGAERDPARLFDLARARLERTSIPAPVRALRLIARELPPFVPAGRDLFDSRPAQALPWEALRERLRARLGEDALYQLACHADPRPEQALRRMPQLQKPDNAMRNTASISVSRERADIANDVMPGTTQPSSPSSPSPSLSPRPTWLLSRPLPLRDHSLQILAGPERIESGWWDGGDMRRDYYLVRTSLGQCAWAFRPAGVSDGAWMLHGWFA